MPAYLNINIKRAHLEQLIILRELPNLFLLRGNILIDNAYKVLSMSNKH